MQKAKNSRDTFGQFMLRARIFIALRLQNA
jgi:hypothetical protein